MADFSLGQFQQQRQTQVLAPQLRQSLELLQVPILELRTLVRQEMDQNPTLEELPDAEDPGEESAGDEVAEEDSDFDDLPADDSKAESEPVEAPAESPQESDGDDAGSEAKTESDASETERRDEFDAEFDALARLDDEWRDYNRQTQESQPYTSDAAAKRQFLFDSLTQPESLQQHLMTQLHFATADQTELQIGELVIGSIDEDGFLTSPVEELASTTGFTVEQILNVLTMVQEFDPIGVGSRDLRECLLIQLRRLGKGDSVAATVVEHHLEDLGGRRFADIARRMKVPVSEIHDAATLIATLEPKPGRLFVSTDEPSYVLAEVSVQKSGDGYAVVMHNDQIPHLKISAQYRALMNDESTRPEVKNYIREKVRAGQFLIKSIGQRQTTIFNIAREIVRVQRDFFDKGIAQLRPLTMNEIAGIVGVHETTVSRAIANKYIETPRGLFEMKYFFTPGYKNAAGESISNKTIKDAIAQLVANEDPDHPLSDQAMVAKLKEQGTVVARRTVAKYREELKILPSHLRKGYAK